MKTKLVIFLLGIVPWGELCFAQSKLSVGQAVNYALSHRPEIRVTDAEVTASEQLRRQAGLISNPRFLFRKEDFRPETSAFGADSQTYYEANQLIETSGKRGGRIALANTGIEQSRLQRDLERRQIALAVRQAYWTARATQALAKLYDEDGRYFSQMIEYHEARFREGKIAEVDLLRVRLQGLQIKAAAANANLDSERALLELAKAMNAPTAGGWQLTDDLEVTEDPLSVPSGTDASTLRIEGQIAKAAVDQTQAQVRLERANGRPDLTFTGGYKRDVQLDSAVAGIQFDLPFFNRNQGAIGAARAEVDASEAQLQATRNHLLAELAIARKDYDLRHEQYLNVFRPLRQEAVEISDISRAAYKAGGLDLVRLLDAERARVDAELSYVRALESLHRSVAELNYAEGMDQ